MAIKQRAVTFRVILNNCPIFTPSLNPRVIIRAISREFTCDVAIRNTCCAFGSWHRGWGLLEGQLSENLWPMPLTTSTTTPTYTITTPTKSFSTPTTPTFPAATFPISTPSKLTTFSHPITPQPTAISTPTKPSISSSTLPTPPTSIPTACIATPSQLTVPTTPLTSQPPSSPTATQSSITPSITPSTSPSSFSTCIASTQPPITTPT
ncbi:hypothetical protein WJX82_006564 [Trebouxia sp. C0006]